MRKHQHKKKVLHRSSKILGKPEYMGDVNIPTSVELIQYSETFFAQKTLNGHDDLKGYLRNDCVNWFKVTGISDVDYISKICKNFGLHSFDIRELLTDSGVVKVVLYNDVTFTLLSGYYLTEDGSVADVQVAFILGPNFVISFKESPILIFKEVDKAIADNNITVRQRGADFLLYLLMNAVNAFNNDFILRSEDNLWEIEDQLILRQETVDILHILRNQRKVHIQLKRLMSSLREEYENLLENSNGMVRKENMIYFENLDDKFRATSNNIENYEESVKSLLDLYYNNTGMRMNEIMKRLTLVATIFIPLTFLAGVWGMNFDEIPEYSFKYGYLMAWIVFIVIAVIVILLMKKKRWF